MSKKYKLAQTACMVADSAVELKILNGGRVSVTGEGETNEVDLSSFIMDGDTINEVIRKSFSNVLSVAAAVLAYENKSEYSDELNTLYKKYLPNES